MDNKSPVPTPVSGKELSEGLERPFARAANAKGAAPPPRAQPRQARPDEVPPETPPRAAPPGNHRPHPHEQEEAEGNRTRDVVEVGGADAHLDAPDRLGEQGGEGPQEDGEAESDQEEIVKKEGALARQERVDGPL